MQTNYFHWFSLDWLRPPADAASRGTPNFRGFGRDRDPGHFCNFAALGAANASSSRNSCVSESRALSLVSETILFREMGAVAPPVGGTQRSGHISFWPQLEFTTRFCHRRTDGRRKQILHRTPTAKHRRARTHARGNVQSVRTAAAPPPHSNEASA